MKRAEVKNLEISSDELLFLHSALIAVVGNLFDGLCCIADAMDDSSEGLKATARMALRNAEDSWKIHAPEKLKDAWGEFEG